jgi:hypothetical protein
LLHGTLSHQIVCQCPPYYPLKEAYTMTPQIYFLYNLSLLYNLIFCLCVRVHASTIAHCYFMYPLHCIA